MENALEESGELAEWTNLCKALDFGPQSRDFEPAPRNTFTNTSALAQTQAEAQVQVQVSLKYEFIYT